MSEHHSDEQVERIVKWVQARSRPLSILGLVLALAAVGVWFTLSARTRRENFAERELLQAKTAADAGNYPLASTELQRVVERYSSTRAGQEAALTLGQLRLIQGQADLAAAEMQTFVGNADAQFRDQGYGLLGTALEQAGKAADAARAYEEAAKASRYRLVSVQMLMSAARAHVAAGDTSAAASDYQRVLDDYKETGAVVEAQLRLAELRRSDTPS